MKQLVFSFMLLSSACGSTADVVAASSQTTPQQPLIPKPTTKQETLDQIVSEIQRIQVSFPDIQVGKVLVNAAEIYHRDLSYLTDAELVDALEKYAVTRPQPNQ